MQLEAVRALSLVTLALAWPIAAGAQAPLKDRRLAILEFEAPWKGRCDALAAGGQAAELERDDRCKALSVFSDAARTAAADQASAAGMVLFTRANTLEILSDQQVCGAEEGSCALAAGRSLGVHFLMVGKVSELEGTYIVDLQVYDVQTGAVLPGASQVEGRGLIDGARAVRKLVPQLLERALGLARGAAPLVASDEAPVSLLDRARLTGVHIPTTITVKPADARLLVDGEPAVPGTPVALLPGTHKISVDREDFIAQTQRLDLIPGQNGAAVAISLLRKPTLTVKTIPEGAQLRLNGAVRGKTAASLVLDPGSYDVELELGGHENVRKQLELKPNQDARLDLLLVRGRSDPEKAKAERLKGWAWRFTAAAAAGVAVFAWQGLEAKALDANKAGLPAGSPAARANAGDQKRASAIADVGLGTALLTAVPAGILWWKVAF